jgi:molybdate transport system substrate-binding protein
VEPRVKIVGLFPAASHPKIVYPAALVGDRPGPGAAAFLAWLKSREAGAVFAKYGFTRP